MPNVTQRMLTIQLRELEADGMIRRKIFPEVPPRVEYSLSELGQTLEPLLPLEPLLRELYRWGEEHLQGGQLAPAGAVDESAKNLHAAATESVE